MIEFIFNNWYVLISYGAASFLALFYLSIRMYTRKFRAYQLRRNLFAIRDELRMKIFENKLSEEARIFKYYDTVLNDMVSNTEKINAYSLMRALTQQGASLRLTEFNEVQKLVRRAHPEVQILIRHFYKEISSLFVRQSKAFLMLAFVIKMLVGCADIFRPHGKLKELVTAFEYRQRFSRMAQTI
jgi:hypothetical protein